MFTNVTIHVKHVLQVHALNVSRSLSDSRTAMHVAFETGFVQAARLIHAEEKKKQKVGQVHKGA